MRGLEQLSPEQYRVMVEDAKDRIVEYVKVMRVEYPYLFKSDRGLIHTEVCDVKG